VRSRRHREQRHGASRWSAWKRDYMLVPYGQARMWYWFHDRADNPFYPDIRIRMTGPRSFSQSLLKHFSIDPILWGVLVFVNLQAAFLSPPVAMSAFYLKGVSPSHVTLNQIFAGMMPYMLVIILCMVLMYIWPGMTLWLPQYLYGG